MQAIADRAALVAGQMLPQVRAAAMLRFSEPDSMPSAYPRCQQASQLVPHSMFFCLYLPAMCWSVVKIVKRPVAR